MVMRTLAKRKLWTDDSCDVKEIEDFQEGEAEAEAEADADAEA